MANTQFPSAINLGDITLISEQIIVDLIGKHPDSVWIMGGGPPCTDVSLLNADRIGAMGAHSSLRIEFERIYHTFAKYLPSNRLFCFMECTRMELEDRVHYDAVFNSYPAEICSSAFTWATRPRLWWSNHDFVWPENTKITNRPDGSILVTPAYQRLPLTDCLEQGWLPFSIRKGLKREEDFSFSCFTRSTPRTKPMSDPRGIELCSASELKQWQQDSWAQSPYQYRQRNQVQSRNGQMRRLISSETERIMGFPKDWTAPLLQVKMQPHEYEHRRKSLLGNAWCVMVVMFVLRAIQVPLPAASANAPELVQHREYNLPLSFQQDLPQDTLKDLQSEIVLTLDSLDKSSNQCEFAASLQETVLGPDLHDMWSAQLSSLYLGWQPTSFGHAKSMTRLIPKGLDPSVHLGVALGTNTPLHNPKPLADDLLFACHKMCDPNYQAWAESRKSSFLKVVQLSKNLTRKFLAVQSPFGKIVCPSVNPGLVFAISWLCRWPDMDLALLPVSGAPIIGEIPPTGIFRATSIQPSVSKHEWDSSAAAWNASLLRRSPPDTEQAEAIWNSSLSEQSEGFLGQWQSKESLDLEYGESGWRAMPRFAIWQSDKWRCIDNGKASQHNAVVDIVDKIHTSSIEVSAAIGHYLASIDHLKRPHCRATRDMRKAYRQIPVAQNQSQYQIICVFNPEIHKWCFAKLRGLAFGLTSAVVSFNRIPAFITMVLRRWFGIPTVNFFDDIRIHSLQEHSKIVWNLTVWVMHQLGWVFDIGKDQPFESVGPFLGFLEDLSELHTSGNITISPKPSFITQVSDSITQALSTNTLDHGQARSLRGKCLHLSTGLQGRAGRPLLYAFEILLQSEGTTIPDELRVCLQFFEFAIKNYKWRTFIPLCVRERTVTLYTDASACGVPPHQKVVLCFIMIDGDRRIGGYAKVSGRILQSFDMKSTYIAHGEALAILFAWWHIKHLIAGRVVLHFIDNLGVLSAFCKGSSAISDISHLVGASIACEVSAMLRVWREHVDSHANLADAGTRDGLDDYKSLNIQVTELALPPWPASVKHALLQDWLALFSLL